jgi:ElaB/YqjD/DUF883 family membrane-anchored ribosome-binding protein
MKKGIENIAMETSDLAQLAEDAKTLLAATAQVAEQKVVEARKRISDALSEGWDMLSEKSVAYCRATDETIRDHPYQSVGVALGLGALIGYLVARR